jgi:biotin-dependent carboxylase-like uncharacterized protein
VNQLRDTVEVVRPGALTTVQDRGRPGFAHLGVPPSGALDSEASARANRLVGNAETAAVLESTVDGVGLRFDEGAVVAVTGATAPVRVDGRPVVWSLPVYVRAGSLVEVGPAELGVRCYVAVAGGFEVPSTLGSRSTDLLSGLGPPVLFAGQRLAVGPPHGPPPAIDFAPYRLPARDLVLPLHPGPRQDWLTEDGRRDLFDQSYRVSPLSNRIALRLEGRPLGRHIGKELPSEGIVWGSVQLMNSGEILVFLADHPTTGGYPVIAVVDRSAASDCAQARPGARVTLRRARASGGAW